MDQCIKNDEIFIPGLLPIHATIGQQTLIGMDLYTVTEHQHEFEELVAISKGEGTHSIEGMEYPVRRGDVFIIKKGQRHYFTERRNMEHINIVFVRDELPLPNSCLANLSGYHALFRVDPGHRGNGKSISHLKLNRSDFTTLRDLTEAMVAAQSAKNEYSDMILLVNLQEIFLLLSQVYTHNTTKGGQKLIQEAKVIAYLENNYTEKVNLETLCKIGSMSRSTLMRRFKYVTGLSPIEYLNRTRIEHAKKFLTSSNASLSRIAEETGFEDSNYFSRQFKKVTHMSPREYRKR